MPALRAQIPQVEELLGGRIGLTDSYMMLPAAAVCALVFAHPKSEYFNVGQINKDQVIRAVLMTLAAGG